MNWYQTLFTEEYLRGRSRYLTPERTLREVDFVTEKLGLADGAKVLDLCCGQGRHAVELARRGFQVTGLDLSEYLLGLAREAAAQANVDVRFIHCDMRDNSFEGEFDAVINMFTAFGYLETDEEDQKVLSQMARSLKPGGKFFLDFINRERVLRNFRVRDWQTLEDGSLLFSSWQFDVHRGKVHTEETTILPDGRREESWHEVRFYSLTELRRMLHEVGLNVTATFGDFEGSEFGLDTPRLILIAEKN